MALKSEPENTTNERGRRMTIRNAQTYEGVTVGEIETEAGEMICCPELDTHGYGEPNLLKESCLAKQKHKDIPMCYGGCKGVRRTEAASGSNPWVLEARREKARALRASIVDLYGQNCEILDIMQALEIKCPATVYKHLKIAGVTLSDRPRVTRKKAVMDLITADQTLSPAALAEKTGVDPRTAQMYKAEFFRNQRQLPTAKEKVFAALDRDSNLTASALAELSGCTMKTAQAYKGEWGSR